MTATGAVTGAIITTDTCVTIAVIEATGSQSTTTGTIAATHGATDMIGTIGGTPGMIGAIGGTTGTRAGAATDAVIGATDIASRRRSG